MNEDFVKHRFIQGGMLKIIREEHRPIVWNAQHQHFKGFPEILPRKTRTIFLAFVPTGNVLDQP